MNERDNQDEIWPFGGQWRLVTRSKLATHWAPIPSGERAVRRMPTAQPPQDGWMAPLTGEQRRDLLEIMEDRHQRGSTIVTSQLPVDHWHQVIGDPTIADAVLDRLVHNAHRMVLKGESLRKQAAKTLMLDAEAAV